MMAASDDVKTDVTGSPKPVRRWKVTARRGSELQAFYVYAATEVEALGRIDKATFRYKGNDEPKPIDEWAETFEVVPVGPHEEGARLVQDMGQREVQKG